MKLAKIVLFIDPEVFEEESGMPLSDEALLDIGRQTNGDAGFIYGYSAWQVFNAEGKEVKGPEHSDNFK